VSLHIVTTFILCELATWSISPPSTTIALTFGKYLWQRTSFECAFSSTINLSIIRFWYICHHTLFGCILLNIHSNKMTQAAFCSMTFQTLILLHCTTLTSDLLWVSCDWNTLHCHRSIIRVSSWFILTWFTYPSSRITAQQRRATLCRCITLLWNIDYIWHVLVYTV